MRWYPDPAWTAGMGGDALAAWNSCSWAQMALLPAALNIVWVAVYYLLVGGAGAGGWGERRCVCVGVCVCDQGMGDTPHACIAPAGASNRHKARRCAAIGPGCRAVRLCQPKVRLRPPPPPGRSLCCSTAASNSAATKTCERASAAWARALLAGMAAAALPLTSLPVNLTPACRLAQVHGHGAATLSPQEPPGQAGAVGAGGAAAAALPGVRSALPLLLRRSAAPAAPLCRMHACTAAWCIVAH
jgi:hypothetical protein